VALQGDGFYLARARACRTGNWTSGPAVRGTRRDRLSWVALPAVITTRRMREALLGRVSRELLEHMTVPVLMSH
jgi:hypothetical protein